MRALVLFAVVFCSLNSFAQMKQAIICRKAENFSDAVAQINGLMQNPSWPTNIEFIKEDKSKGNITVTLKDFMFDIAHAQYFESKEKITEGSGKNKKTRDAVIYNACVPVKID